MNPTALHAVFVIHWQRRHELRSRKWLKSTVIPAMKRMKGKA